MIRTATLTLCLGLLIGCGDSQPGAESSIPEPDPASRTGGAAGGEPAAAATESSDAGVTGSPAAIAAACPHGWAGEYDGFPSWPLSNNATQTNHNSHVVFADVDGKDGEDLIVSSGNDELMESMEAYYQTSNGEYPPARDWYSEQNDPEWPGQLYYGKFAVGDIDKDGCNEVVAAVFFGVDKGMNKGGVVYFDNEPVDGDVAQGCTLKRDHTVITSEMDRFTAPSLTLADVNGDAWLDVVVAVAFKGNVKFDKTVKNQPANVKSGDFSRIYINKKTKPAGFEHKALWKNQKKMRAGDVEFADVDEDGFGDLVFAGRQQPRIFWGEQPSNANDGTGIDPKGCPSKSYVTEFRDHISFSVDVVRSAAKESYVAYVTADTARLSATPAPVFRSFEVYQAKRATPEEQALGAESCVLEPYWSSLTKGRPSAVRFGDLLGTSDLYLLAGRWADEQEESDGGSLLRIYSHHPTAVKPDRFKLEACLGQPTNEPVVNGIGLVNRKPQCEETKEYLKDVKTQKRLVTLPRHLVAAIEKVELENGTAVSGDDYAWVPGENWVSFSSDVAGKMVKITYRTAQRWDIGYGDWSKYTRPKIHYNMVAKEGCQ